MFGNDELCSEHLCPYSAVCRCLEVELIGPRGSMFKILIVIVQMPSTSKVVPICTPKSPLALLSINTGYSLKKNFFSNRDNDICYLICTSLILHLLSSSPLSYLHISLPPLPRFHPFSFLSPSLSSSFPTSFSHSTPLSHALPHISHPRLALLP